MREWDFDAHGRCQVLRVEYLSRLCEGVQIVPHIMVATDGSQGADRAVDVGADFAKTLGGELSILTVGGNLSGDEMRQIARAERDLGDALDAISNQILMQSKERARRIGVSTVKVEVAWGDPAEAIIETARREQVNAIVVGRRGRGQLAGLLLGSVSQKVASLAPCIVIVVP
jgi:nucleotide-binding universal stress UspA family protein